MDLFALAVARSDDVLGIGGAATPTSIADLSTGVGVVVLTILMWLLPADLVIQSPRRRTVAYPLLVFAGLPIAAVGSVISRWDLSPSATWSLVGGWVLIWWAYRGPIRDAADDERDELFALKRIIKRDEADQHHNLEQPFGPPPHSLPSLEAELAEVKAELRFQRECFPERVEVAVLLRELEEARAELARLRPASENVNKEARAFPRLVRPRRR